MTEPAEPAGGHCRAPSVSGVHARSGGDPRCPYGDGQRKFAIACVVDEHGGVEGIITPKDLLAELVGELQDEYDPGVPSVVRIGPKQWVADGRLPIEDLSSEVGRPLPSGPHSTAAGFFMAAAGHVPDEGDRTERQDGNRGTIPVFGT